MNRAPPEDSTSAAPLFGLAINVTRRDAARTLPVGRTRVGQRQPTNCVCSVLDDPVCRRYPQMIQCSWRRRFRTRILPPIWTAGRRLPTLRRRRWPPLPPRTAPPQIIRCIRIGNQPSSGCEGREGISLRHSRLDCSWPAGNLGQFHLSGAVRNVRVCWSRSSWPSLGARTPGRTA